SEADRGVFGSGVMTGKQRGGHVAGAVALEWQVRGLDDIGVAAVGGNHFNAAFFGLRTLHGSNQHDARAHSLGSLDGIEGFFQVADLLTSQKTQLELIRGDDIGNWHDLIAQKWRDFIGDEAAGFLVTHHRITRVKRVGVDCLDTSDGIDDRAGDIRAALVARDNGVDLFKSAAALNSVDDARYISSRD